VRFTAERYASALQADLEGVGARISEAAPAPLSKIKNVFRYQIIVRYRSASRIVAAIKAVGQRLPIGHAVALSVDVDALDLM
jgi:primosomal protein N'